MPDSPVVTPAVVNKAAKTAAASAAAVSGTLPTVVETAELALEVPAKVVLNQKLVVTASVLGGAVLGAGILFGVNKFLTRNKTVVVVDEEKEPTDAIKPAI